MGTDSEEFRRCDCVGLSRLGESEAFEVSNCLGDVQEESGEGRICLDEYPEGSRIDDRGAGRPEFQCGDSKRGDVFRAQGLWTRVERDVKSP